MQYYSTVATVVATFFLAFSAFAETVQREKEPPIYGTVRDARPSFMDLLEDFEDISKFEKQLALAVNGDPVAQGKVAEAYYDGRGVAQNFYKAEQWACRAAKQGDFLGQTIVIKASLASTRTYRDVVTCYNVSIDPSKRPKRRPDTFSVSGN